MGAWDFSMVERYCRTALGRIDRTQTPDRRVWKRNMSGTERGRGATYLRPRSAKVLPAR